MEVMRAELADGMDVGCEGREASKMGSGLDNWKKCPFSPLCLVWINSYWII